MPLVPGRLGSGSSLFPLLLALALVIGSPIPRAPPAAAAPLFSPCAEVPSLPPYLPNASFSVELYIELATLDLAREERSLLEAPPSGALKSCHSPVLQWHRPTACRPAQAVKTAINFVPRRDSLTSADPRDISMHRRAMAQKSFFAPGGGRGQTRVP